LSLSYNLTNTPAGEICAQIKQRISIPSLWRYHNLPGEPEPGGRCHSPFYQDNNPDFFISRNGSWFKDWGEPDHKGDVITFEQLARGCTRGEAIIKLRELANLPQAACNTLKVKPVQFSPPKELQPLKLDLLQWGTRDDRKQLAALRGFAPEALEIATAAGLLRFATLRGSRAWIVTDKTRCIAEARRLDGKAWQHICGAKVWTLPSGNKKWPLGILEAQNCRAIALVEGSADFIAACHLIWAEERFDVAPVAMLGASMSIHPVALPFFRGKHVRIFPHYDADRFKGFDAARKWDAQLRSVGAIVDCFNCSGLTRNNGEAVSDLNDLCSVDSDQWQQEIRELMP
jgi:hypothetical protein